jgi:hypothetical protein
VTGLLIFTALMMAGCVFLIHFLVALWCDAWCDARNQRGAPRVEVIQLVARRDLTRHKSGRLHSYSTDHFRVRDMTDSERDCEYP